MGLGFGLGTVIGLAGGLVAARYPLWDAFTAGIICVFRPLSAVALVPMAVILAGIDLVAATSVIAFVTFWIVSLGGRDAIRAAAAQRPPCADGPPQRLRWSSLCRDVLPVVLRSLVSIVRLAHGQAWAALVAIEALGNHGIAYAITQASFRLQVDRMLVYGLSVVVLYGMIDACLVLIGKAIILRWAPREGRLLATLGQS